MIHETAFKFSCHQVVVNDPSYQAQVKALRNEKLDEVWKISASILFTQKGNLGGEGTAQW